MPTDAEVEDFLMHVGVKGMKWGVRKAESGGAVAVKTAKAVKAAPSEGAAKAKKIAAEIGFSSLGPAAVIAGLGPPISIAIGVSVHVLRQPPVRNAMAKTAKASADLMREIGDTKFIAMRQADAQKR